MGSSEHRLLYDYLKDLVEKQGENLPSLDELKTKLIGLSADSEKQRHYYQAICQIIIIYHLKRKQRATVNDIMKEYNIQVSDKGTVIFPEKLPPRLAKMLRAIATIID